MNTAQISMSTRFLVVLLVAFCLGAEPTAAHAMGIAADNMCFPETGMCQWPTPCNPPSPQPIGVIGKYCQDVTNGHVTAGACVSPKKCMGKTGGGEKLGDPKQLMDMAKQLMDMLKGKGGGGGGGSGSDTASSTGYGGCTTYYQVSVPTSDPCAIYQPTTSSNINTALPLNTSGDLLSALTGGGTNADTTGLSGLLNLTGAHETGTGGGSTNSNTSGTTTPASVGVPAGLSTGVSGDIRTIDGGATVIINNQNTEANTEVAGFYGSETSGGQQPQGLVAGMCQTRPWATNFLNYIIPPSFFDSICSLRGYQVGAPKSPTVTVVQNKTKPVTKPATTTVLVATTTVVSGPVIPPEADIWAVPTSVPLGARTTIFWSTKGVTTCTVTSPDGSFNQTNLSGGAATVPLSGPTTFTISCNTPAGGHVTNFTTVGMTN